MKILITGITGFVGASLVHYFHENKRVSIFGHSRDMRKAEEKFADYKIEFISELNLYINISDFLFLIEN